MNTLRESARICLSKYISVQHSHAHIIRVNIISDQNRNQKWKSPQKSLACKTEQQGDSCETGGPPAKTMHIWRKILIVLGCIAAAMAAVGLIKKPGSVYKDKPEEKNLLWYRLELFGG